MSTLTELIQSNEQRPIRKCYIKRRLITGEYEANWVRIDNYNGDDRVVKWGTASLSITGSPSSISSFEISSISMQFTNVDSFWNRETDSNSFFYDDQTYMRQYSKIKIECGYEDEDGSEVGVTSVYEGLVDKVTLSDREVATISIQNYLSILTRYDFSDLTITGNQTASFLFDAIMNQTKITKVIPYQAPTFTNDIEFDTSNLSGTYWEVVKKIAFYTQTVPYLVGDDFRMLERSAGETAVYNFEGNVQDGSDDIIRISSYDDEGRDKVRLHFIERDGTLEAKSSSTNLLTRYLGDPQEVDLAPINSTADKNTFLTSVLSNWENPKPVVKFVTRFMVNEIKPLNRITISNDGAIESSNSLYWNNFFWNDGGIWGNRTGSIVFDTGISWLVTAVTKEIDNWTTSIVAERILIE